MLKNGAPPDNVPSCTILYLWNCKLLSFEQADQILNVIPLVHDIISLGIDHFKSWLVFRSLWLMDHLIMNCIMGVKRPSKRGGGVDLNKEVGHNKCLWYKNDKKCKG